MHFKDAGHLVGQPACRPLDIRLGDFRNHICAPLDGVLDRNLGTRCRLAHKEASAPISPTSRGTSACMCVRVCVRARPRLATLKGQLEDLFKHIVEAIAEERHVSS